MPDNYKAHKIIGSVEWLKAREQYAQIHRDVIALMERI